ncbi:MAG: hypothetical protein L0Y79_10190, partial [Chlorobi bacterium]|nr:hypothetical protein [Chlorobiota bacterium]
MNKIALHLSEISSQFLKSNLTMKRLLFFELLVLFLATTFESDSPPGWFQQTLPVSDVINDIFFLDSLTGWVVTQGGNN